MSCCFDFYENFFIDFLYLTIYSFFYYSLVTVGLDKKSFLSFIFSFGKKILSRTSQFISKKAYNSYG